MPFDADTLTAFAYGLGSEATSDGTTVIGKFYFGDPSTAAPTPGK